MNSYARMYYMLFNKISDIIHELQDIQNEVEKMYISCEAEELEEAKDGLPDKMNK